MSEPKITVHEGLNLEIELDSKTPMTIYYKDTCNPDEKFTTLRITSHESNSSQCELCIDGELEEDMLKVLYTLKGGLTFLINKIEKGKPE